MFCVVAALLQLYVYGVVPPLTVMLIEPFALPQLASVTVGALMVGPLRLLTVALVVVVQLFASVTVTVYVLAATLDKFCVVAVLLQLYVYGDVPPFTVNVTLPLL